MYSKEFLPIERAKTKRNKKQRSTSDDQIVSPLVGNDLLGFQTFNNEVNVPNKC